jgi:hypothetical protein
MKNNRIAFLALATLVVSCGPSQEELAKRAKFVADSLEVVRQDSIAIENERIHLEKIEVGESILETQLSNLLDDLKKRLITEENELAQIQRFQWGRSQSTKDKQLSAQYDKIGTIESGIKKVEREISMTKLHESFDFQDTPKGTVEHLFYAAKNSDYKKVRHLLDPYGEYNTDMREICLVEMLSDQDKAEWKSALENGRIMSEPVITNDHAVVEVAIGSASDRLKKIELAQRMGKWYIIGLS